MKWSFVEPERGRLWFDDGDFVVAYGEKNTIKVRGHCLVWHEQNPGWLDRVITRENARDLLVERVRTMCGRYSGRIHSWDVVNEAVNPRDGRPDGLRDTLWLRTIGPEYIELAFRTARVADPATLLTYNEWGLETDSAEDEDRRRAVLLLMRRLRARNVPIDAVGIQSHLHTSDGFRIGSDLRKFIAQLRELNLQVFLTEVDVDDSRAPLDEARRDAAVTERVRALLENALPDSAVRAVLTWGLSTRNTWMKGRYKNAATRGLPFDDGFRPLPMFAALREGFDLAADSAGRQGGRQSDGRGTLPRDRSSGAAGGSGAGNAPSKSTKTRPNLPPLR